MKGSPPLPPVPEDVLEAASDAAAAWRDARAKETAAREWRDEQIRSARQLGAGVREIARAVGMDATNVSRILRAHP